MREEDREDEPSRTPGDERSNSPNHDYGQPIFTSPTPQPPFYTTVHTINKSVTHGVPPSAIPSPYPPHPQTFTTLPPISISSGLPPITLPPGSQPISMSSPPATLPQPINVPGGIIMGPPITISSNSFLPGIPSSIPSAGISSGVPTGLPLSYREERIRPPSNIIPNYDMVPRA